jgi:hypothetical protein
MTRGEPSRPGVVNKASGSPQECLLLGLTADEHHGDVGPIRCGFPGLRFGYDHTKLGLAR